jgi:hypothetical protein
MTSYKRNNNHIKVFFQVSWGRQATSRTIMKKEKSEEGMNGKQSKFTHEP